VLKKLKKRSVITMSEITTTLSTPENVATMLLHVPGAQIKYTFECDGFPRLGSKRDAKVSIEIRLLSKRRAPSGVESVKFASLALDKKGYHPDLLAAGYALAQVGFRVTSLQTSKGAVLPSKVILESAKFVAELRYDEPFVPVQIKPV
jgi:hypothetical protein